MLQILSRKRNYRRAFRVGQLMLRENSNLLRFPLCTENSPEMASSWDQQHAGVEVTRSRRRRREKQEGIVRAAEWRLMRGLEK